jgi:hypothetical protein
VFELARAVKSIPSLSDADADDLLPIVREWHHRALPFISTEPVEETIIDFLKAWPRVKFPRGTEPMAEILTRAVANEPETAQRYESPQIRLLVSLCRELQRAAGDGPFYLSCHTAGRLLGADPKSANRWLFLLERDGVLRIIAKGSQSSRKATRYRYLPDD